MAIARASTTFGRTVFRRAATQTRVQAWRQIGRRQYSSDHGKKSSELPWIIGSVGFTVPASVWLFGQGPKGVHHPEAANEEREENDTDENDPAEGAREAVPGEAAPSKGSNQDPEHEKPSTKERLARQEGSDDDSDGSKDDQSDDGSDDSSDEKKDDKEDDKEEPKQDKKEHLKSEDKSDNKEETSEQKSEDKSEDKSDDKSDNGDGPNAPGQINHKPSTGKGPGEGQKGSRPPPELQHEKDSHKDESGAKNPYLDDPEKGKKGEGVKETAKIHGTVDPARPAR